MSPDRQKEARTRRCPLNLVLTNTGLSADGDKTENEEQCDVGILKGCEERVYLHKNRKHNRRIRRKCAVKDGAETEISYFGVLKYSDARDLLRRMRCPQTARPHAPTS